MNVAYLLHIVKGLEALKITNTETNTLWLVRLADPIKYLKDAYGRSPSIGDPSSVLCSS